MKALDVFWILLLVFTLQPAIRQWLLMAARRRLIAAIEKKRGSRVILLVHRQETMGFLGFPLFRFIDIEDAEQVLRAVEMTDPEMPLDVILHTPGGLVLPSFQIASALAMHKGPVRVLVPHYAMSGGTLVALAANEILMSPNAVLGPIDPQVGQYPAASILAVVEKKPIADTDDETLIFADLARKAIEQVRASVHHILSRHYPEETTEKLTDALTQGKWTHDFPITLEHARALGLNVSSEMPPEVLALMSLYPQAVRRQRGVEYLPYPHRRETRPAGQ